MDLHSIPVIVDVQTAAGRWIETPALLTVQEVRHRQKQPPIACDAKNQTSSHQHIYGTDADHHNGGGGFNCHFYTFAGAKQAKPCDRT